MMIDFLIKSVASELGIAPQFVEQLKSSKIKIDNAELKQGYLGESMVSVLIDVVHPEYRFPLLVTLPESVLMRVPKIYNQVMAVALANAECEGGGRPA